MVMILLMMVIQGAVRNLAQHGVHWEVAVAAATFAYCSELAAAAAVSMFLVRELLVPGHSAQCSGGTHSTLLLPPPSRYKIHFQNLSSKYIV